MIIENISLEVLYVMHISGECITFHMSKSSSKKSDRPRVEMGLTTGTDLTPQQIAATIKDIARRIKEESARMRETVQTIKQSGAIEELTAAVHDAAIAARDTSMEINETAKTLEERGLIRDTALAVDETSRMAKDTAETVKRTAQQAFKKEKPAGVR